MKGCIIYRKTVSLRFILVDEAFLALHQPFTVVFMLSIAGISSIMSTAGSAHELPMLGDAQNTCRCHEAAHLGLTLAHAKKLLAFVFLYIY